MASLTVIDLPVRADVRRADMVLACLVTRVGMGLLLEFLDHSPDCNLGMDQSPDCNLDSDRDRGL